MTSASPGTPNRDPSKDELANPGVSTEEVEDPGRERQRPEGRRRRPHRPRPEARTPDGEAERRVRRHRPAGRRRTTPSSGWRGVRGRPERAGLHGPRPLPRHDGDDARGIRRPSSDRHIPSKLGRRSSAHTTAAGTSISSMAERRSMGCREVPLPRPPPPATAGSAAPLRTSDGYHVRSDRRGPRASQPGARHFPVVDSVQRLACAAFAASFRSRS